MPLLKNVTTTQLNTEAWCATAQIISTDLTSQTNPSYSLKDRELKRQRQRTGVRMLLQRLLKQLDIIDTLDESAFPYRLNHTGYYVCFSHSGEQVAVAISRQSPVGIDIELSAIKWQVINRYYHGEELKTLLTLPKIQRDTLSRLLWQTKESFVKIRQTTLAHELGLSYLPFLKNLIDNNVGTSLVSLDNDISNYYATDYQITILCHEQIVVVL